MPKGVIMDSYDVMRAVKDTMIPDRYCPTCGGKRPMVMFWETTPSCATGGRRENRKYRCMGCLSLWDEYEGKVE